MCVSVKISVSSISLYKLDPDTQTTPFELAHQFTLVYTFLDSKTVPGCHYTDLGAITSVPAIVASAIPLFVQVGH